jgi:hypothetical protein
VEEEGRQEYECETLCGTGRLNIMPGNYDIKEKEINNLLFTRVIYFYTNHDKYLGLRFIPYNR